MSTTTNLPYHLPSKDFSTENKLTSQPSQKTILDLLNTRCSTSLHYLKQVHAMALRTGHFQDHYVSGTLVKCYANPHFSNLDFALRVFEYVPNPNVFVFNIIIKGCLENNEPCKAIWCYYKMTVAHARPNKFTYPTLLKACTVAEAAEEGSQAHAHVIKQGT
ncbi:TETRATRICOPEPTIDE-LIKE HELICAL DOMAIN DYW DOMAIN PROTEIN-RELATED [Salix viminalis]|uniref:TETRATRICOPEPTIDE-LIKE HELICAL DOMAIN DYW DOMAIN PROTEIN-RELATED n=1 Tax=Salix viminalis TaxID=40686 RepID=A0A9Q0UWZ5_SALVM|nr:TETRATRICOPEPTIDE-LIKE HELICAL DOMAIN DYW DOMAIN PROTEIN-RELATED [Salix viminalis]